MDVLTNFVIQRNVLLGQIEKCVIWGIHDFLMIQLICWLLSIAACSELKIFCSFLRPQIISSKAQRVHCCYGKESMNAYTRCRFNEFFSVKRIFCFEIKCFIHESMSELISAGDFSCWFFLRHIALTYCKSGEKHHFRVVRWCFLSRIFVLIFLFWGHES